jgi:sulfatase modifying factor 1
MRAAFDKLRRALLGVGVGVGVAACTFGIDTGALTSGAPLDASGGDGSEPPGDGSPLDGAADRDGPVDASACPSGRGPAMVRIVAKQGSLCIDATEATNDDYAAFLAAPDKADESRLALACRGRSSWTPTGAWPPTPGTGRYPVAFVDFCDAQAFCVWSGKALCGAIAGGPLPPTSMSQPASDAWFLGCGGVTQAYPYGGTYDGTVCNGVDFGATHTTPVASRERCTSGPAGPFDMSGNVWEWIDACETDVDAGDRCYVRGGAFNAPAVELTCASQRGGLRSMADATVGIRCCSL